MLRFKVMNILRANVALAQRTLSECLIESIIDGFSLLIGLMSSPVQLISKKYHLII